MEVFYQLKEGVILRPCFATFWRSRFFLRL